MKHFLAFIIFLLCIFSTYSQGWNSKSNLPSTGRREVRLFDLNGKLYLVFGYDGTNLYNELWEYNPSADQWVAKSPFPGNSREAGVAFSIGGLGYAGLGWELNQSNSLRDFYAYNANTDTWIQKASFPTSFSRNTLHGSSGTKAYVGGGTRGTNIPYSNQFWEYNTLTDTWSLLGVLPFGRRSGGIGLSHNGIVYFGFGHDGSNSFNDFWSYDPINGNWAQLASLPGQTRLQPSAFVINNNIIVGGGHTLGTPAPLSDYYMYDISSNTWSTICSPSLARRSNTKGIAINGIGYITCGRPVSNVMLNDLIEFTNVERTIDTSICLQNSITLKSNVQAATYLWNNGTNNDSLKINTTGLYWVRATKNGCIQTDTFKVTFTNFNLDLGPDTTICQGNDLRLDVTQSGANYLWQDNSTSSTFTVQQSGLYWVEVDISGCKARDSIRVDFENYPIVDLGKDTILCEGSTLNFNVNNLGASYLWQDNSISSTYTVQQSGLYWVEVDINGCKERDSIQVIYQLSPNVDLGPDTIICQGNDLRLDVSQSGANYLWQDNSTSSIFTVQQSGLYWVEVDLNGCAKRDSIQVTFQSNPKVDLGVDTAICQGSNLTIDATRVGASYLWQDNSSNPTYTVQQAGLYWVEVGLNGCVDRDSIIISLKTPPKVNLGNDTSVCQADFWLDATTTNGSYLWHDNSVQSTFHVTQTGLYWVEVEVNDCKARDSILVSSSNPPIVNLGDDKSLCIGEAIWLNPVFNSLGTMTWQDSIVADQLAVSDSGNYWVELKNDCGTARDTVSVFTEDCDCRVFMPNVFTPNQDYLNEKFEPVTKCNYLSYRLKIFNRWGTEIYKTDVPNEGWDGTVSGQNAPQGSYVYRIEYSNKVVVDKVLVGTFTLIR